MSFWKSERGNRAMKEVFSAGEIGFEVRRSRVQVFVKGKYGADISIEGKGLVEGEPIEDSFQLSTEEFMDFMFAVYGIEEKWKWNDDVRRVEVGRAGDWFVKFTNFARNQRTIFYLKNRDKEKLLLKLETVRGLLPEVRFKHENRVTVVYDWKNLHFITERESDLLYGYSLELFKEIIRDGLTSEVGFLSFGAGRISINKPSGSISIGGKAYKDRTVTHTFYLAEGVGIPKLTAKTYLAVR